MLIKLHPSVEVVLLKHYERGVLYMYVIDLQAA